MMRRFKMMCSTMSAFWNVAWADDLDDTGPNESLSARMHRQGKKQNEDRINKLFNDDEHCRNAHRTDVEDAKALLRSVGEY